MKNGSRVSRLLLAVLASVFILAGAGCERIETKTLNQARLQNQDTVAPAHVSSSEEVVAYGLQERERSYLAAESHILPYLTCVRQETHSTPWKYTKTRQMLIDAWSENDLKEANVKEVDERFEERYAKGWRVHSACFEPERHRMYFSMWQIDAGDEIEISDLYAAVPGEKNPRGLGSVLGVVEWPEYAWTWSPMTMRLSKTIGIMGNGDADTFRDISMDQDTLYGRISTGTLDADAVFTADGKTLLQNICTMNPFADDPESTYTCYKNK